MWWSVTSEREDLIKDIAVVHQLQVLKPGSDRIPKVLWNLCGRTLKLKKGTNVAHVEANQVVPLFDDPLERGDVCEGITEDITKGSQSEDLTKEKGKRTSKILEKLNLTGIESWTEQQQCSVKKLLEEYQHLFALNLKELGKTSLVQHEIRLSKTHLLRIGIGAYLLINMKKLENIFKKC